MSNKVQLREELSELGYKLGAFASKETLTNILRLHSTVLAEKNINVGQLSDPELRQFLIDYSYLVGPVTNHTRAIYQRQLLEVLTNESTEGGYETDQSSSDTNEDNRLYPELYEEPVVLKNYQKATVQNSDLRIRNQKSTAKTVDEDKLQVTNKSGGTGLYAGITIAVALIVFVLYFLLSN